VGGWEERQEALLEILEEMPETEGPVGWGALPSLGAVFTVSHLDEIKGVADLAYACFTEALGKLGLGAARITRLEVTPMEEDDGPPLVGASDIARMLGISRQRVYQLVRQPPFPKPVAKLARGLMWDRRAIEALRRRREANLLSRTTQRS
jgi:predicted DNA-binding transcriptional regulator AlpA